MISMAHIARAVTDLIRQIDATIAEIYEDGGDT